MKIYLVGGAVRDKLRGIVVSECDWVVVGATPEDLLAKGFKPVGKSFPVFLHPETKEEYALARTERKIGPGYHGFSFEFSPSVTLEQDLGRRDLTVNAMAEDNNGKLIDPFGGKDDLEQGCLRHVSEAFREDPVRLLRLARFWSFLVLDGFFVDENTKMLCREMVLQGEVDALSPERIFKELERALKGPSPRHFFEFLIEVDAFYRVLNLNEDEAFKLSGFNRLEIATVCQLSAELRLIFFLSAWSFEEAEKALQRLKVPNTYKDSLTMWHGVWALLEGEEKLSASKIISLFSLLGLCGRVDFSEVKEPLLCVWHILDRDKRELSFLEELWFKAISYSAKDAIKEGLSGSAISDRVQKVRESIIFDSCQTQH